MKVILIRVIIVKKYVLCPIITESFVKQYCPINLDPFHFSIQH